MLDTMPRKPKTPAPEESKGDRAARSMVAVPPDLHEQLKKLADRNGRPISWELRRILKRELEQEGLWPPPDEHAE